jgi:hypothetical protein
VISDLPLLGILRLTGDIWSTRTLRDVVSLASRLMDTESVGEESMLMRCVLVYGFLSTLPDKSDSDGDITDKSWSLAVSCLGDLIQIPSYTDDPDTSSAVETIPRSHDCSFPPQRPIVPQ